MNEMNNVIVLIGDEKNKFYLIPLRFGNEKCLSLKEK